MVCRRYGEAKKVRLQILSPIFCDRLLIVVFQHLNDQLHFFMLFIFNRQAKIQKYTLVLQENLSWTYITDLTNHSFLHHPTVMAQLALKELRFLNFNMLRALRFAHNLNHVSGWLSKWLNSTIRLRTLKAWKLRQQTLYLTHQDGYPISFNRHGLLSKNARGKYKRVKRVLLPFH